MLKKLLSLVMVALILSSAVCIGAFAKTDEEKALEEVMKANEKIDKTVQKAIDKAIKKGEKYSDSEIQKLIDKTNGAAIKGIIKASKNGVEVECEYIVIVIGDEVIVIDPLRVIRA